MNSQEFLEDFGRKIKCVRVFNGLSQGEMAEILGISQSGISELESGKREMGAIMIKKFCDYFDYPPVMLLRTGKGRKRGDCSFLNN